MTRCDICGAPVQLLLRRVFSSSDEYRKELTGNYCADCTDLVMRDPAHALKLKKSWRGRIVRLLNRLS